MTFNFRKLINKIIIIYLAIPFLICLVLYPLLPILLNYPPNSIDNSFQLKVDGITYTQQYIVLVCLIILLSCFLLFIRISRLKRYIVKLSCAHSKNAIIEFLSKIRTTCLNTPFLLYYLEISIPIVVLPVSFIMIEAYNLTIIKICLIYISFFTLASVISFISSQKEFKNILINLHAKYPHEMDNLAKNDKKNKINKSLYVKLILQILPLAIIALIITSLIGYTQACKKTGEIYYSAYIPIISPIKNHSYKDLSDLKNTLNSLTLLDNSHTTFILSSNGTYETSNNELLTPFLVEYTLQNSESENSRIFDYYCLDYEGIVQKIYTLDGNTYYVGILYDTSQPMFLNFILISGFSILLIIIVTLLYITISLSKEIRLVTDSLNKIVKNNDLDNTLPASSEDEINDLIVSFNDVQKMTNSNIKKIQENQDLLIEKERLASLGQLVGGIAHNLKTPIMSIAGAAEGLTDLTKEYDTSIDDPEVNSSDHHEIARDMTEWIEKIKTHTSYMSDIITAVKGQAVTLSEDTEDAFTIEELLKRINILMRHELKNALIELRTNTTIDTSFSLKGNVNSLVQVINNLISNAIQAYNGKTNEVMDLLVEKTEHEIVISVRDYGCGMPDEVQDKLFKEMITTKGKNGTGLGLFMSYSTIRGHFNGNITFESELGKGTVFHVILPLD